MPCDFEDSLIADILEETAGGKRLNAWERNFIEDIQDAGELTQAQADKLTEIYNTYCQGRE